MKMDGGVKGSNEKRCLFFQPGSAVRELGPSTSARLSLLQINAIRSPSLRMTELLSNHFKSI